MKENKCKHDSMDVVNTIITVMFEVIKKNDTLTTLFSMEGRSVLFNDELNTFYLWLYDIR